MSDYDDDYENDKDYRATRDVLERFDRLHTMLESLGERIMSALDTAIAAIQKAASDNVAAQAQLATAVGDNTTAVDDLVAEVKAGGTPTAAQLQAITDAATALENTSATTASTAAALDAAAKGVDPGPQPSPGP
jgi:uncharacterized protein with gpF-like domain